jgi:hypothetical protein
LCPARLSGTNGTRKGGNSAAGVGVTARPACHPSHAARDAAAVAGKRIQLATKEELKVPAGEWHTMKIQQVGDQIECWLDGKKHLEAKDDAIPKAGKAGLWTKADAQTYFDDFQVRDLGK